MTDAIRSAWAWGLATVHNTGDVLDAWFPEPPLGTDPADEPSSTLVEAQVVDEIRQVQIKTVRVAIDTLCTRCHGQRKYGPPGGTTCTCG